MVATTLWGLDIVGGSRSIRTGDPVILFLVDKKHIRDVEKLFHVGLSFF
jgi:hypothetical protein